MSTVPEAPEESLQPNVSGAELASGNGQGSVLDRVKQRRDESLSDEVWFDIPSWNGELKVRYGILERNEIEKMIREVQARLRQGSKTAGSQNDLNFLVKACEGVKAVDDMTEEEEVIADGYTMDLAGLLDPKYPAMLNGKPHPQAGEPVNIKSPPELVAYLFAWNNIAIATHAQKVGLWMQTMKVPIEDPQ